MVNKRSLLYCLYSIPTQLFLHPGVQLMGLHNYDNSYSAFANSVDFVHILMYIRIRKRDNGNEGVPLPISQRWNIKV